MYELQGRSGTMRKTIRGKSIPAYRNAIVISAFLLGLSFGSKDLRAQSPAPLEIRSQALSVALDPKFPRVFHYQTTNGKSLPAALESSRPTVRLNGQTFAGSDLNIRAQSTASSSTYAMRIPSL